MFFNVIFVCFSIWQVWKFLFCYYSIIHYFFFFYFNSTLWIGMSIAAQCLDILPVSITSIKHWDAHFLVRESLSWCWLAIQLTVISFLAYISLRADNFTCRRRLSVGFVVFTASWSDRLSVKAWMLIWHDLVIKMFSFNRFWIKKAVSHPSWRASVSAASVERLTLFSLLEFQAMDVDLLFLSHKKTMYPPWQPSSGKLLKLASGIGGFPKNREQMVVF